MAKVYPQEYFKKFVQQSVRPDGRKLTKVRKTTISTGLDNASGDEDDTALNCGLFTGSIKSAEGSAIVKIGNTTAVAGIKAQLIVPLDEHPDKGTIGKLISVSFAPNMITEMVACGRSKC